MEQNLKLIEEEIKEALKKNKAYAQTIMSMPGIGMITSLAIMLKRLCQCLGSV
ncbi:hypothetical protein LEP1GSC115_3466 [Leptospira interrogans serovar Australis str. 200703203]|uniref:Transposase, IS116/IS110/IS902 domain protein n=1 Tax=Leptospira interrogans serovar Australis str. 200703203 TaxID=1085541 RepID=N1UBP0_LEPIR|nr:hypothetical protein LEP1GSC115_3466 [Leptospira interrogans serovar Australis str. 200703203]